MACESKPGNFREKVWKSLETKIKDNYFECGPMTNSEFQRANGETVFLENCQGLVRNKVKRLSKESEDSWYFVDNQGFSPGNVLHPIQPFWVSHCCWLRNPEVVHELLWAGFRREWPENCWCSTFKRKQQKVHYKNLVRSLKKHSYFKVSNKASQKYCPKLGRKK